MADKSGKILPGPSYVEVEYDYEYEAKDKRIVIKQGQRYILVKKTNDDWWQVKTDENSKPFYVPAQYVKEVTRKALMPPTKPPGVLPNSSLKLMHGLQRSTENVNKSPELSSFGKSSPVQGSDLVRDANQNLGPSSSPGQNTSLNPDLAQNNGKFNEFQFPKVSNQNRTFSISHFPYSECLEIEKTSFLQEPSCDSAGEGSEKIHQDSESGDELSSSSTEQTQPTTPPSQGRPDSPVYANLQELKISQSALPPLPTSPPIQINAEWETHKDATGRCYYYNKGTQERTWKPPRWTRDPSINKGDSSNQVDPETLSSQENSHSSCNSQSDSQYGSPPQGWSEELDERGQTLYTSDYTNEKWIRHVDEQGRSYYYNADGSRSEWALPKYNASPQQPREIIKSRSLDRRLQEPIVLTKWRHSSIVLDTNDKDSLVASKSTFPENDSSPSSPKHQDTDQEKYGLLNVTKITENGKKVRKNWMSSWAVLQGSSLLFTFKTQGGGTSWKFGVNQSKPEFTVDLRGAVIERASKEKSSKKNVIELKTRQGTELLIQSDNDISIMEWLKVLNSAISNQAAESDEVLDDEVPDSPGAEKQDKEKDHKDTRKLRSIKTSSSIDSSEQKKTKTKLKKFLTRRPTLQAVREKGYIKDQVFGCNLSSLCQRENSTVPKFVKLCIEHVEEHGLNVDGLYRVSGNLAVIQKLRFAVNHDEKLDLNDSKWEDIHVITGALKMFFRELPEPLFTFSHFNDFVNAIKQEPRQRVQAVRELIKQLPKPNQDTMQVLFKHLKRVVENGEKNRMTYQSTAIVFGPTLLKPEKETGNIAVHTVYQNQIVELILLELNSIFGR
ncbi:hypothetical protein JRQ81_018496 [Phrynocephalus forsythii]|uniref:Rho GTPase-activating protein 12 n=1 Tax=Phrynocephalus forsythii TaxID=171643 RepID=A0A9Q0XPN2_9SAUR|nr:hypothetical protein JRQ81_018496 [Phrynocephalus forsythii]